MKRFYKLVSKSKTDNGWSVDLDGRTVKTPMKAELTIPTEALADAIMAEWSAQEDVIDPETMPLTQLLSTQIDRIQNQREALRGEVLKFLDTDLICYRAPDHEDEPETVREQAKRQAEIWDEWTAWFADKFNAELQTTIHIAALRQHEDAHKATADFVDALDDAHFTVLQMTVPLAGSIVLAMAFVDGALSAEKLLAAARVEENLKDEIYNAEFYGRDPMQKEKDAAILRDLNAAEKYLKLLKS